MTAPVVVREFDESLSEAAGSPRHAARPGGCAGIDVLRPPRVENKYSCRIEFRTASPDESELLSQLVLAGVAHWGHDVNFPDAVAGLRTNGLPNPDFITTNVVEVLLDGMDVAGFYSLAASEDHIELVHMFVEVDRIGTGCGRRLWERAVAQAHTTGRRMLIMADPAAKAFYTAMGATLEREVEVSPGFALGRMWYEPDPPGTR